MILDKNVYSGDTSDSVQEDILSLTHWQPANFTRLLTLGGCCMCDVPFEFACSSRVCLCRRTPGTAASSHS